MRQSIILAVTGFMLVMLVRFPARWASPLLPHGVHCQQLEGSAWSGSCSGLTRGASTMGDLTWDLHALQLLRARLELRLDLTNQGSYVRGDVAFGFGGALHGRDLSVDLPLTSQLVSSLPAGAQARLMGKLSRVEWTGKYLAGLEGQLDIQDLVGAQGQAFGNYQATFGATGSQAAPTRPAAWSTIAAARWRWMPPCS